MKSRLSMEALGFLWLTVAVSAAGPAGREALARDDSLQESAAGARSGGVFVDGGRQVTGKNDTVSNVKARDRASATNAVRLNGKSFCDHAGPFLGLGVSYFQALRHAKHDRARLDRNLALFAAAVFAYLANLPAYVYHSRAGVFGYARRCPPAGSEERFEDSAGINAYQYLRRILPPDLASWARQDGLESSAPFTVFCNGQPNRYWPDVSAPKNGCHRNIGSAKGHEFVCFPMGILGGGLTLEARRPLQFQVVHPLTGAVVSSLTLNGGDRFTLPQGPGAYLLKGTLIEKP